MILVDWQIQEAIQREELEIRGFSKECVEPASYDLRVGEEAYTTSAGEVISVREEGELRIAPGEFALVMTHEYLKLPNNFLGRFGLRSSHARRGLLATTGPQVDPGFEGRLVIGLVNFSPDSIALTYLDRICSLELHRLDEAAHQGYEGPYQKQEHLTEHMMKQLPQQAMPLAMMLLTQLAACFPGVERAVAGQPARRISAHTLAEPGQAKFSHEKAAFERMKPRLLKSDRGRYVVIHDGRVALKGDDETELAREAYRRFGYAEVYIGLIEEGEPVVHMPSPHVRGDA